MLDNTSVIKWDEYTKRTKIIALVILSVLLLCVLYFLKTQTPLFGVASEPWNTENSDRLFSYNHLHIDPECLTDLGQSDRGVTSINFAACTRPEIVKKLATDDNGYVVADNPIDVGQDYNGFSQYKVVANKGDVFIIETTFTDGGSSIFDSILFVKLSADGIAVVDKIRGGDRCNGGITGVYTAKGRELLYSKSVTPLDVIRLASSTTKIGYNDLENTVTSCVGVANYAYEIDDRMPVLQSMHLSGPLKNVPGVTSKYNYQSCYNKFANSYTGKAGNGSVEIGKGDLPDFAKNFLQTCVDKK